MAGLLFAPQVRYGQGKSSFHETSRLIPSKALYLLMFFGTTQQLAEKRALARLSQLSTCRWAKAFRISKAYQKVSTTNEAG
jgi:hypothetical protein